MVRDEDGISGLVQKFEHHETPINGVHVFRGAQFMCFSKSKFHHCCNVVDFLLSSQSMAKVTVPINFVLGQGI